jgi:hypothetical protein
MGINLIGQRKKIILKIKELKEQLRKRKAETVSDMPAKKLKQQTLSFAPAAKVPPPAESLPYQKWWYKDPKFPRTKYSNEILPLIYRSAYPILQTKFEEYFFRERAWRYEYKEWKDKMDHQLTVSTDRKNLASYARYLEDGSRSIGTQHMKRCNEGIDKMTELADNIAEKKMELKYVKGELYIGNTLKGGMAEKDEFIQMEIDDLCRMEKICSDIKCKLQDKLNEVKQISKGIGRKPSSKKREQKKDAKRAKNRKEKRLDERIKSILHKLLEQPNLSEQPKIDQINENKLQMLHKRYDLPVLAEMLRRGIFVDNAAEKVKCFLKSSESESDASTFDSSNDSDDEII